MAHHLPNKDVTPDISDDEEFASDTCEKDYDALNEETFGAGATCDDWEEEHSLFAKHDIKTPDQEKTGGKVEPDLLFPDIKFNNLQLQHARQNMSVFPSTLMMPMDLANNMPTPAFPPHLQQHRLVSRDHQQHGLPPYRLPVASRSMQLPARPFPDVQTLEDVEKNLIQSSKNNASAMSRGSPTCQFVASKAPPPGLPAPTSSSSFIVPNEQLLLDSFRGLGLDQDNSQLHSMLTQTNNINMQQRMHQRHGAVPRSPVFHDTRNRQRMQQHVPRQSDRRQSSQIGGRRGGRYYGMQGANSAGTSRNASSVDPYAELMTQRERDWLMNIQMLQLATTQPKVDDYYYDRWRKRHTRRNVPPLMSRLSNNCDNTRNNSYSDNINNRPIDIHNTNRERRDSDRDMTPSPRVYVPLQFENSLGKLQCGSVTAPRKIIDTDVVSDVQGENVNLAARDSKRTKYLLLEVERCFTLLLILEEMTDDEDLPVDADVFMGETKPKTVETLMNLLMKNDKLTQILGVRKGKMLLLRLLPLLTTPEYHGTVFTLWCKFLQFFQGIARRDHDNFIVNYFPFFQKWLNKSTYPQLTKLISIIVTPSPAKNLLPYIMANELGVSMMCLIIERLQYYYERADEDAVQVGKNMSDLLTQMSSLSNMENFASPVTRVKSDKISQILRFKNGLHNSLVKKLFSSLEIVNS